MISLSSDRPKALIHHPKCCKHSPPTHPEHQAWAGKTTTETTMPDCQSMLLGQTKPGITARGRVPSNACLASSLSQSGRARGGQHILNPDP